jgi:GH43 family beta-xylosidase
MYGKTIDWYTLEGPTVIRHSNKYHLFFSGGSWEGDGYGVSVATASHPLGPWSHVPAQQASLLSTARTGLVGPGHNSVLRTEDGDILAFHAWNRDRTARQMHIRRLAWDETGPRCA